MWIKRVEIESFKSFMQPESIAFARGFNLILGANNAGKSTVLQALDLNQEFTATHRSVENLPTYGMQPAGQPRATIEMCVSAEEFRQSRPTAAWRLPVRDDRSSELGELPPQLRLARLLAEKDITVSMERGGSERVRFDGNYIGMPPRSRSGVEPTTVLIVSEQSGGPIVSSQIQGEAAAAREIWPHVAACYASRMYRFDAGRAATSKSAVSPVGVLQSNISNLAACVMHLQTNDPEAHRLLCQWVNRVLPNIHAVQAPPVSDSHVELRCFPRPLTERRADLAVPLNQMGSGVGGVVAALYVVLTSRTPQVICIDEPNLFLHPKALRELLHILATEGKQHQYILTAHSAEVINAVKAETVTLLTLDDGVTRIQQTTRDGLAKLRHGFADLGIRATELHGRDRVLWVEGQTEELVFPSLLAHFCTEHAAGTAVLRVHETGAFNKTGFDPIKMVEIYTRLTVASALVPPLVAVVLDRERRTPEQCTKLEADKRGNLRFLPRPMLENYLLHPQALAHVLSDLGEPIEADDLERFVVAEAGVDCLADIDVARADGASLLKRVFSKISSARWEFKKTRDVPSIVDWLLEHDPAFLKPLGDWLASLMTLATPQENSGSV